MRWGKSEFVNYDRGTEKEWLISNGRSGFAGATIIGANNRKYHSLLNASLKSPDERYNILSMVEEKLVADGETFAISTTKFEDKIIEGYKNLQSFSYEGIPSYRYFIEGAFIDKRITMEYGKNTTVIEYSIVTASKEVELLLKPCLSFRRPGEEGSSKSLSFKKSVIDKGFNLNPTVKKDLDIKIYLTEGTVSSNKESITDKVFYDIDKSTGDPHLESYYIPGELRVKVPAKTNRKFYFVATIEDTESINPKNIFKESDKRIKGLREPFKNDSRTIAKYLPIAADNFIVDRASTNCKTILAGYPWFLDWGRDTMIAFPGLVLATGRFDDAKEILKSFAIYEKNGLIPNMFPDNGAEPLYNTVDASLWYIHCIYMYLLYTKDEKEFEFVKEDLYGTAKNIINAYKKGTDFSIKMKDNALINAGSGLDQVTWMDVRVDEIVVTPRHGCPVEINALWYNALKIMSLLGEKYGDEDYKSYESLAHDVSESFNKEFWYEEGGYLYDVVNDTKKDNSIRPNQIWALSLPFTMLPEDKEEKVLNKVLGELYTPYGLRSLNKNHEDYKESYDGKLFKRDMAYHQGTVWSFPIGAFFTAYCKVNKYSKEAVYFVDSLLMDMENHMEDRCIGSISEILDGDSPHIPRGAFAQAWGVGEILRVYYEDILGNHKKLSSIL